MYLRVYDNTNVPGADPPGPPAEEGTREKTELRQRPGELHRQPAGQSDGDSASPAAENPADRAGWPDQHGGRAPPRLPDQEHSLLSPGH